MGRHAAPDRWAFWRSFAKAVGGALLALLLTAALVLLLVDMGQSRVVILPGQRVAEDVDPSPSPGPAPVRPESSEPQQGDGPGSEEPGPQGRAAESVESVESVEPDQSAGQDEPAGPDEPDPEPGVASRDPGGTRGTDNPGGTDGWANEGVPPGSGEVLPGDARPAAELTVQVLDGAGNPAGARAVAALLGDLGYDVVVVGQARRRAATTVFWSAGFRTEAWVLLAVDERFSVVEENPNLTQTVDLHVVVGGDWPR